VKPTLIIELFAILVGIGLVMVIVGFSTDTMVYCTVGFLFLFLISFTLINSTLQYQSGSNVTDSGTTMSIVNIYSTYGDNTRTYGIYMAIGSGLGMILTFIQGIKKKGASS
jgi:hypothetical protein